MGHFWPNVAYIWKGSTRLGGTWPTFGANFGQFRPKLPKLWPSSTTSGRHLLSFGQLRRNSGKTWPTREKRGLTGHNGSHFGQSSPSGATVRRLWGNSGQFRVFAELAWIAAGNFGERAASTCTGNLILSATLGLYRNAAITARGQRSGQPGGPQPVAPGPREDRDVARVDRCHGHRQHVPLRGLVHLCHAPDAGRERPVSADAPRAAFSPPEARRIGVALRRA